MASGPLRQRIFCVDKTRPSRGNGGGQKNTLIVAYENLVCESIESCLKSAGSRRACKAAVNDAGAVFLAVKLTRCLGAA